MREEIENKLMGCGVLPIPFPLKVKSAEVGLRWKKHTHLEPWKGGEIRSAARWGSGLRPALLGQFNSPCPAPRGWLKRGF